MTICFFLLHRRRYRQRFRVPRDEHPETRASEVLDVDRRHRFLLHEERERTCVVHRSDRFDVQFSRSTKQAERSRNDGWCDTFHEHQQPKRYPDSE